MGDFKAKVGNGVTAYVTGNYGLGESNEKGDAVKDRCKSKNICIMNTMFKHHKRRLRTWQSPGDRSRNQIDYICEK